MPLGEPQFATVSLLLGDAVEGTFRVPITDETTVRRLAKDAMHRLIARSNTGRHVIPRDKISVSEVFVKSGTDKAEIFAQDLVNQVVLVKEEVLYMRLRIRETVMAGMGEEFLTATTSTVGATTSNIDKNGRMNSTTVQTVDVHSSTGEPPQEKASKGKKNSVATEKPIEHTSSSFLSSGAAAGERCKAQNGKRAKQEGREETEVKKEDAGTVAGGGNGKGTGRGLGWGPEAHKCFADNYITSPNRLMQKSRAKREVTAKKATTPVTKLKGKRKLPEKEPSPEVDAVTQPKRRLGWGPEAEKYFPDNYVASPDRIARLKRQEKRMQEKKKKEEEEAAREERKKKEKEEEEAKMRKKNAASSAPTFPSIVQSLEKRLNENQHRGTSPDCISTVTTRKIKGGTSEGDREPRTAPTALAVASTPHQNHGNACRRSTGSNLSRKRRLGEIGEDGSALFPIVVERQLSFEAAEETFTTHTPKEQSTRQLLEGGTAVGEPQQKAPPQGWGKEATRYFDVETYFDDPSKARLSAEILARPIRARRDVVLPYYFSAISK
ncbi:hypothetical protein TcG_02280 [Trypanosoma cruzi]|nr:hypothetical protein TcG_02280 [Trypanosoma cruzi]